ncbi:unnamed protein product [Mytilus edulis]|uniref:Ig-like domain-containing protein n=1 Tax=Mytilus edulis TaxID=6550 RepID=A0A8S3PQ40_MYTED|nr:unnamed protein product [Mytilus edulis]
MIAVGNVRKHVTVTVEAMFTSEYKPIKCVEGETLQLKCSVYSEDINVEWSKDDAKIKQNENISIEIDGKDHCLTIQQAKLSDAGQYMMAAGNVRKHVTVTVEAMFTSEFNQINCIVGEKLQLKCSVYLENVNVEWFKNDKKIFENENISIENDGKYHFMTVQKAEMKDAGQYIIKAGNVQNQLAVTVKVLPEAINRLQEKDRTRYIELMQSSEMEKRYYVRIMVVGKESVGKTSLVRRLLLKNIDDVVSTDGVDIVVDQCKINIEDGSWLIDGSSDDKIDRISRALNSIPNKRSIKEESNISRSKESKNGNKQVEDVANSLEDMNNTTLYQTETSTNMVDKMSANSTSKGKISGVDIGSRSMSTSDTKDTDQTENYHEGDIKTLRI